ncbi:hypothetical protein [Mucilaginibacter flavus]|uniref:HU domain-containing protein n=1 Tax=Mucilaginibacter flavus TaxID=931504 RepID=UPI0025B557A1|nr:hypothetical protein [Mucilaginibacter flavus]MDN3584057.1 hypothetical protein [Mucilaginibacter flavus]
MDIANYLSELLSEHGQISVPGLGHFVHVRVNAWYNDAERKFYPPGYKIEFNAQPIEGDDTLTNYIAEKKKISLASSKYFTDKYISGLKQEASLKEVAFADLGWFFMDKGKIAFKSQINKTDTAEFFGYEPISIKKLNQTAEPEVVTPIAAATSIVSVPTADVPVENSEPETTPEPLPLPPPIRAYTPVAEQPEEYFEEEPEERRGLSLWIIILVVIIILGSALFTVYKFKPELLHLKKSKGEEMVLPAETKTPPVAKHDTDSLKSAVKPADSVKAISKPDSALKKTTTVVAPPVDTVAKPVFAIFAGSFKTIKKGENAVNDFKAKGLDARILTGPGTGKRIKIIIGSFPTFADAEKERLKLIASKKIEPTSNSYSQQLPNTQK